MFFRNKQKELEAQLVRYREKAAETVTRFRDSFKRCCESGDIEQLRIDVAEVHRAESQADDIRREIEVAMYSKALFPESRGDVLGLLESMDKVVNQAESAVRMIVNQFIAIPESLHPKLFQLVDVCCRCFDTMLDASAKVFTDFSTATSLVGKIDELESEADGIEADLLQNIFSSDLKDLRKVLLRDLVGKISGISDRAENVGDRIRIVVAKRLV